MIRAALICLLVLAAGGCQPGPDEHQASFRALHTEVTVHLRGVEDHVAGQAFARLERDFRHMHRQWSPDQRGALDELNRQLPDGGWISTTPDAIELIELAREMERRSEGLFNAALGQVIDLWRADPLHPAAGESPAREAIATVMAHQPTILDVTVEGRRVRSANRAVQFDFGGMVTGLAAHRACARLADFHITDAMIDFGAKVMVCGAGELPWRVTIDDPAGEPLTTVALRQRQAVFTEDSFQTLDRDADRPRHPVLDPDTGHPVDHAMQVTVLDEDPVLADAAATALVVAGPVIWRTIAREMAVERVVVIDADGRIEVSEELEDAFH